MIDYKEAIDRVRDVADFTKSDTGDSIVSFLCEEEYYGAIPEPKPAYKVMPEWYKDIPLETDGSNERTKLRSSTVKSCMPFLEAMCTGWIIPSPADISLTVTEGGDKFEYEWKFEEPAFDHFPISTIPTFPLDGPVLKFNNFWMIKTPPEWSMIFLPVLNKPNGMFEAFAGVVNTDKWRRLINFPVYWYKGDYDGIIERGTPVVQAIPVHRERTLDRGVIGSMDDEESMEKTKQKRQHGSQQRIYKEEMWEPINRSKVVDN